MGEDSIYWKFIKVVLYLLLAFAFFASYFVKGNNISVSGPRIFFFGIISIILLVIFWIKYEYYNRDTRNEKVFWAVFSIVPFALTILHVLFVMYFKETGGIKEILCAESNWVIYGVLIFMILIGIISLLIKKKMLLIKINLK